MLGLHSKHRMVGTSKVSIKYESNFNPVKKSMGLLCYKSCTDLIYYQSEVGFSKMWEKCNLKFVAFCCCFFFTLNESRPT